VIEEICKYLWFTNRFEDLTKYELHKIGAYIYELTKSNKLPTPNIARVEGEQTTDDGLAKTGER
jgi:hypothetical protein